MISIITAIHNQLAMNKLFYESVCAATRSEWEMIIIDNCSTDGSAEFFENVDPRVKVVRNKANYSYPYCQNQGIELAKGEVLAFFNNDIFLSDKWDLRVRGILGKDGFETLTLCSNDNMVSTAEAKKLNRRFKRIKYPLLKIFGAKDWTLRLMLKLTYRNWNGFCNALWQKEGVGTFTGFCGSAVLMTRRALEILGKWDASQQGADFDLFYRTVERSRSHGDIKPLSVVSGVYHHHFSRLTFNAGFPQYADMDSLLPIERKWSVEKRLEYDALLRH